jgi:hypothetical protein
MSRTIKDALVSLIASVVAGLILWQIQSNTTITSIGWWLLVISVLVGVCVYLSIFVYRCKSLGVSKILATSIKGEGSTSKYMASANSSICFVGIAASKWVKEGDALEKAIRKICALNTGYIRFLLLNPESSAAQKLSLAGSQNSDDVSTKIKKSVYDISRMINRLSIDYPQALDKFEVRYYDQMPVFRLAIIDNRRAYFCFYQLGCDGSKLKQFVIKPKQGDNPNTQNIFNSMLEHFDSLWNASLTIKCDLTQSCNTESES